MHGSDIAQAGRERQRWATAISNVTSPSIIALFTFVLVNYAVSSRLSFVGLTVLTTLFAAVVPLWILLAWIRTRARYADNAAEAGRWCWVAASTVSYFFGTAVLLLIRAPPLIAVVAFGYGTCMLVMLIINLRWKISVHTMGIAVPTAVLAFVFGAWGLTCGLLLPPVIWSRVYLKKHTIAQALAGALVSFVLMALILVLLLS